MNSKEFYYFLGFLWADGYLWENLKIYQTRIILENKIADLNPLMKHFNKFAKFYTLEIKKKNSKNIFLRAIIYKKELYNFLKSYGYKDKFGPHLIINYIPEEFHGIFWRGLMDGDGCFGIYYRRKRKSTDYRCELTSGKTQNWIFLEEFCKKNDIKYKIKIIKNQSGTVSNFSIGQIESMVKFGDLIYKTYQNDKIGLKRKYLKFEKIKNHWKLCTKNNS